MKESSFKEISPSGELMVYIKGKLIYKRWPYGSSMIMESYGIPTTNVDRDRKSYDQ